MKRGLPYLQSPEKRALDVSGSLFLGALSLPVCVASGAVLGAELDLNVRDLLLRQERHGVEGIFRSIKLRTLPLSDQPIVTYGTFDHRAGPVGKYIRQLGLDEIPQFANVLAGDMSLVGPRPLIESDFEKYEGIDPALFGEWRAMYDEVKPGMFGPSQILKHGQRVMTDQVRQRVMELDLEYAERAGLVKDVGIILNTPADLVVASLRAFRQPMMPMGEEVA